MDSTPYVREHCIDPGLTQFILIRYRYANIDANFREKNKNWR